MISKRYHCRPVHFSILDARALNVVLAQWVLSRMTTIRAESANLLNIPNASCDVVACGGYRMLVPLSRLWLALVPVVQGVGGRYVVLILGFDRRIYDEFKGIMMQMNVAKQMLKNKRGTS